MPKWFQNDAKMCPEGDSSEEGGHSYFLLPFRMATSHVFLEQRLQRSNVTHIFPCVCGVNSRRNQNFKGPATTKESLRNRASRFYAFTGW